MARSRRFTRVYGSWVTLFTALAICFFAFTTALGWGLYGSRCTEFVFGPRAVKPFLILYAPLSISVVAKAGYRCPIIITPMDFLERREEFGL